MFTPPPVSPAAVKVVLSGLDQPAPRPSSFMRGVSLGLFASAKEAKERRRIYDIMLEEIRAIGATDVQLVVRWAQSDVAANDILRKPGITAPDDDLRAVIASAHDRNLRVFLMPIIHLEQRATGKWRGTIKPSDLNAWWGAYEAFVLHYAELAQSTDVELFSVGSELVSMEAQEARWRQLIAQVRKRYRGRLTYSANWDHFEPVRIWDAVDVAGVTAYQPLSRAAHPTAQELGDGWRPFRQRVQRWAQEKKLSYVFTEVGFPSNENAARRPWDQRERGTPQLDLQAECFRSLYVTWQAEPKLDGVFVWNWFGKGGAEDRGYTPRGKPAGEVLRYWFEGSAPAAH